MPNRILKESICRSDDIEKLTYMQEVLFYRLIVNCDDFGRFDGRVLIIKNTLFPLRKNITEKDIKDALDKLAAVGLVSCYEVSGKPILQLPGWERHQRVRNKKSKYPGPDDSVSDNPLSIDSELLTSDSELRPESNPNPNPIQSLSESESESNARAKPPVLDTSIPDMNERVKKFHEDMRAYRESMNPKGESE